MDLRPGGSVRMDCVMKSLALEMPITNGIFGRRTPPMTEMPEYLHKKCQICQREIEDNMVYYKHPRYGIVCERCPQFEDGGVEVIDD